MDAKNEGKINKIAKSIVQIAHPQKIILFGSYAWGVPTQESDADLLVIQDTTVTRKERAGLLRQKLFPPEMAYDLLVYTPQEIENRLAIGDLFIMKIMNQGKTLYG